MRPPGAGLVGPLVKHSGEDLGPGGNCEDTGPVSWASPVQLSSTAMHTVCRIPAWAVPGSRRTEPAQGTSSGMATAKGTSRSPLKTLEGTGSYGGSRQCVQTGQETPVLGVSVRGSLSPREGEELAGAGLQFLGPLPGVAGGTPGPVRRDLKQVSLIPGLSLPASAPLPV